MLCYNVGKQVNLHYLNIDNWERSTKLKTESSKRTIGLDDNTLAIQKRLGHSDVQTTLSVYSHLYPNFDKEITENLKNLI